VTRIASQLSDHRHLGHALAVLFSVGGTPAIYYGDEQGLRGVKEDRAGGDDAIRPAYPADPDHLPASGWPVYRLHQQLIAMRRRHPWLTAARTTVADLTNRAVALQASAPGGGTRVITLLNADDRSHDFPLDLSGVVTIEMLGPAAQSGEPATVPAHAWRIIVARPIHG
jgi:cyclomaltodextrinase / maltogenic alpha-amylase / neopullulanase